MYQDSRSRSRKATLFKIVFVASLPILSLTSPIVTTAQSAHTTRPDSVVQLVHISALSASSRDTYRSYSELAKTDRTEQLWRDSDYAGATVALTESNKVYTWGNNIRGHVGNGATCTLSSPGQYLKQPPCHYDQPQDITKYFGDDKVVKLISGNAMVIALTASGKLYYWGSDWNPILGKNVTFNRPIRLDALSPYRITGFGGDYANYSGKDAWCAYNDDTIFLVSSRAPFVFNNDSDHIIKPELDGATIRQVDYLDSEYTPDKNGIYILTSKNKLLHIKFDGSTTEVTNDKIKSRGGIKQILNNYALDHQGRLWFYGHGDNIDSPIQDLSQKTTRPLPIARDLIDNIGSSHSTTIRSTDGHIYNVYKYRFDDDHQILNTMMVKSIDVTTLISKERIKLISGDMEQRAPEDSHIVEGYYDYSFITESKPNVVCTGLSGVAVRDFNRENEGENPPKTETIRPVNDTLPATCVKIPPVAISTPTPTPRPSPSAPDFTPKRDNLRAPNTGSQ